MAEFAKRQEQVRHITQRLRAAGKDDIKRVITYLAIANHYIQDSPATKSTAATLYTITLTQKVMETYVKMIEARDKTFDPSLEGNYRKHLDKVVMQMETYLDTM